jgi:hypothetical protein
MKKIALLAATALVASTSFTTPAFASHTPANATTIANMQSQCSTIQGQLGSAFSVTLDHSSISGSPTGDAVDSGDPYNVGSQQGVGDPALSNFVATGLVGHTNGGSQNIFTTGEATATWATYTFSGEIATVRPFSFSFSCSVTETVSTPGGIENKGQCVSRLQQIGQPRNAAEELCDNPANRLSTPGGTATEPRTPVAGTAVAQDVAGTRTITNELNTAYPSLASTPLVVNNYAVPNVLACNSPDNNQTWVNRNSSTLVCGTEAAKLGLTPISGKTRR